MLSCAGGNKQMDSLQNTIDAYRKAVIEDNPKAAYALLDKDAQTLTSWNEFLENWKKNRKEMLEQANSINKTAEIRLKVENPDGSTVEMVTEKGKWKVESAPGIEKNSLTPATVLENMASALEKMDFNLFLNLLAPEYRKAIIDAIAAKLKQINYAHNQVKDSKDNTQDTMNIPLDQSNKTFIILKKYGKSWKIYGFKTETPTLRRRRR